MRYELKITLDVVDRDSQVGVELTSQGLDDLIELIEGDIEPYHSVEIYNPDIPSVDVSRIQLVNIEVFNVD